MSELESNFGSQQFCHLIEKDSNFKGGSLKVLVVGCAWGKEVHYIKERLGALTVGIELDRVEIAPATHRDGLLQANAQQMPFATVAFDAVFAHHVLEHVADPKEATQEIARVSKPGAVLYIGVPNKTRLVSLGTTDGKFTSLIATNYRDYRNRLRGRFENELGAHAGFTTDELYELVSPYYDKFQDLTADYMRGKYAHHKRLVGIATLKSLVNLSATSHYIVCERKR